MTPDNTLIIAFFGLLYFATVYLICLACVLNNGDWTDAPWWPIHLAKALLKSLYRALFTGWKL